MNFAERFKLIFPNIPFLTYVRQLEKSLSDCDSVLDIGCGNDSPLHYVTRKKYSVGVDGYKPALTESKQKRIHDKYFQADILAVGALFKAQSFDAVIALDVIEHFTKKDGLTLLKAMERLAKKKVIIMTPNGFVPQHNKENNLQTHLSGWSEKEFRKLGYTVTGMYGWKALRKEEGKIKYSPKILWGLISEFTHYFFTKNYPPAAFSLFTQKQIS